MPRKAREVEAGPTRKGFVAEDRHHRYFVYFTVGGLKTSVATYTSQG